MCKSRRVAKCVRGVRVGVSADVGRRRVDGGGVRGGVLQPHVQRGQAVLAAQRARRAHVLRLARPARQMSHLLYANLDPFTAATSLGVKRFRALNTTINIKNILWAFKVCLLYLLGNYQIWQIYSSAALKGLTTRLRSTYNRYRGSGSKTSQKHNSPLQGIGYIDINLNLKWQSIVVSYKEICFMLCNQDLTYTF
jgi:predicted phosphoadenosine phosphosulfate sulfurtransferase